MKISLEAKEMALLHIIHDMGRTAQHSDNPYCWLNWFCNDEVHNKHSDTFNRCHEKGWLHTTHDGDFEISTTILTQAGEAALTAAPASAEPVTFEPFHVSRSGDGTKQWFSARDAASGVSIPCTSRDQAVNFVASLNRAFTCHLRMALTAAPASAEPVKITDEMVEAAAEALFNRDNGGERSWSRYNAAAGNNAVIFRMDARAALEAAFPTGQVKFKCANCRHEYAVSREKAYRENHPYSYYTAECPSCGKFNQEPA